MGDEITQPQKRHKCEKCEYSTNRKANLTRHIGFKHEKKTTRELCPTYFCQHDRKRSDCKQCNPIAHRKRLDKQNLSNSLREKIFKCDKCKYKATTQRELKMHFGYKHEKKTTRELEPSKYCEHNRRRSKCNECNPV